MLDLPSGMTYTDTQVDGFDSQVKDHNLQRAAFPLTLELESKELPERSWVKVSQIRPLSVERIGKKLGLATPEELGQVIEGLNEIIG